MKKNVTAVILSLVMAVGSIGGTAVFAAEAETTTEQAVRVQEENIEDTTDADGSLTDEDAVEEESVHTEDNSGILEGVTEDDPEDESETVTNPEEETEDEFNTAAEYEEESVKESDLESIEEDIADLNSNEKKDTMLEAVEEETGSISDTISYTIQDGVLSFTGSGALTNGLSPNTEIKKVIIGEGITSIESNCLAGFSGMTEVEIADSVTKIASYAFSSCTGLADVTLPSGLVELDGCAFKNCTGLTAVTIPSTLTTITAVYYGGDHRGPFMGCSSLAEVTLGEGMENTPSRLMQDCTGLTKVNWPESLKTIGSYTFNGCTGLTEIVIPDSVGKIASYAFSGCTGLADVTLPSGLVELDGCAFKNCTGLTAVTIPSTLTTITAVYYGGDQRGPFMGCSSLAEVTLGEGMENTLSRLMQDCTGLTKVNWPASLKTIGSYTFSGCTGMTVFDVPSTVQEIGSYAYSNCTALTEIDIPDSVGKIASHAFSGCTGLADVTLPSGLVELDGCAFKNCTGLTAVTIPSTLTTITAVYDGGDHRGPFMGCSRLAEVEIADGSEIIPPRLLQDCNGLEIVHIPGSVNSIGNYAFSNCTALNSVVYSGDESEWNNITIGTNNELPGDAAFYFNGDVPQTMDKPKEPLLYAEAVGHKTVHLTWTYDGDATLLSSYILYRSFDGENYSSIRALDGTYTEYTDKVRFNGSSQTVYYRIKVYDKYGRSNVSENIMAVASSTDTEKPIAVMSPSQLKYVVIGDTYHFSGGLSTDNDQIASYNWDFGDGSTASGREVSHAFTATGNHTVTLTVVDVNSLSSSVSQTVNVIELSENSAYTRLLLTVCNATNKEAIPRVQIVIKGENYEDTVTAPNGTLQYILPNGGYTLDILADKYISRTVKINAAGGNQEHVIGLTSGNILSGSISVTEMTYSEIVEAGIDVDAPGNQHVYKFATVLTFVAGPKQYEIPVKVIKNQNNEIIGSGSYKFDPSYTENGEYFDLPTIEIYPITEKFILIIYGEAHWLKEMYKVELYVNNDSQTDTIEQLTAELILPEGLSLADMTNGVQTAEQQLGTLGYNENTNAVWYVRGDQEGEYNLTAKVHGVSMPYGDFIDVEFTTSEPVKVIAGSALHLTITCPDVAERGKDYTVKFRLENVSRKSLYNLSFGITGSEQYKVIGYGDEEAWLYLDGFSYGDEWSHKVDELAPGGYIELALSTTIWFNSALELAQLIPKVGKFVDVAYYLTDVSVVTLGGSTTEIPYSIVVERAERDYLLDKLVDELVEKLLDEAGVDLPGSLGGTMIEIIGDDLGLSSTLVSTAKTVLKLQKGETNHSLLISVDDGRGASDSIFNDYLSVTSGTGSEAIVDTLNGTKLKVEGSEISITAQGPGSTKLKIGVMNSVGKMEREYVIDVNVKDHKLGSKLTVTPDSTTGKFYLDENEFKAAVKTEHDQELEVYKENPYQLVMPTVTIETTGQTSDSKYSVVVKSDNLKDLMNQTTVGNVEVKGQAGNLKFSRETLEMITLAEGDVDISAERLEEAHQADGTWNAYYKFTVQTTVGEVTDFNGKEVTVEVPFEIPSYITNPIILVDHIKDDGSVENLNGVYNAETGMVQFATTGFSTFHVYVDQSSLPVIETPIENAEITGISDQLYSGSPIEQDITVTYNGTELAAGTDYEVVYSDNTMPGTAVVTITGIGDYTGTITKTFVINQLDTSVLASANAVNGGVVFKWNTVTGANKYCVLRKVGTGSWTKLAVTASTSYTDKAVAPGKKYTYTVVCVADDEKTYVSEYNTTGKAITFAATPTLGTVTNTATGVKFTWKKPAGAVKYRVFRKTGAGGWTRLVDTTALSYVDKSVKSGTKYTYTVRCITSDGKYYTGGYNTTGKFTVYEARTAISSLASGTAGKMTVKWKRNAKASGYQVQYSKSKSFSSGNKTATITKNTLINKTIGSLTKGKKYYVRVRCFKTVSGKKYYSAWSAVKAVTIKK